MVLDRGDRDEERLGDLAILASAGCEDDYLAAIEATGLGVQAVRPNPAYRFLSPRAQAAADRFGVTSVSVLAVKPH